ncbi:MAG: amidase [Pseudomonadota bacterium]
MMRLVLLVPLVLLGCTATSQTVSDEDITQLTVQELRSALGRGDVSATEVTQAFLLRIQNIDDTGPKLNAVLEINPDALNIAQALDTKKAAGETLGPLHGIPVLLKANIDTGDKMATHAGSLALLNHYAKKDAFHVAKLREAGAIVLGKTNLSEWANFRSENSVSGWSSVGGQTKNPYGIDRNPCGSSSGSGVAVSARLAPLAVGTETDGSIVCPSGVNGIVGIKPSIGLVSRSGIIPIAHTQDTAGPMANSVYGAALMLESMVGKDSADTASVTTSAEYAPDVDGLRLDGVRIGVWRGYFGSNNASVTQIFDQSIKALTDLGADIVDPIELEVPNDVGGAEYQVLLYEFKAGLNAYLASHDVDESVNSLAKLIEFNNAHKDTAMPIFGQEIFLLAEDKGDLESEEYLEALQNSHHKMRSILDDVFAANDLDVILAPTNGPSWKIDWVNGDFFGLSSSRLAAVSGYASVTVPAGFVHDLPIGVSFIGAGFSEKNLIQYAYAFEQKTKARKDPDFLSNIKLEDDLN